MADWDGAMVTDRHSDATEARRRVEALLAAGVDVAIVSGTHMENIDAQLAARPSGPGRLYLCVNRGSEVFEVGRDGPVPVFERSAELGEDSALDWAAAMTTAQLERAGLVASVVSKRRNRRKIDLIDEPEWADPPKARITELLAAVELRLGQVGLSLPDVVELARRCARDAGLEDPRITSDAKHVEIGLTDKADSARWLMERFAQRGIGPGLVLVLGDEFGPLGGVPGSDSHMLVPGTERALVVSVGTEPEGVPRGVFHLGGGPAAAMALLDDQLVRRRRGHCPDIDVDPGWVLVVPDGPDDAHRAHEAKLTVADGTTGTRGALEEERRGDDPMVFAAGVFERGTDGVERLLTGPRWAHVPVTRKGTPGRRLLDLRTGVLRREKDGDGEAIVTTRFASLEEPGILALRTEGPARMLRRSLAFQPPRGVDAAHYESDDDSAVVRSNLGGGIAMAALQRDTVVGDARIIERLVAATTSTHEPPLVDAARRRVRHAAARGFDDVLRTHRAAWASRWADADVCIDGDPDAQLAVRFALFHLMASVPVRGEGAVGARGMSGSAYAGHVFWDTDVFVLPFLAATCPAAARAVLEYRIRRLPAARRFAAENGRGGARFPWESAHDGTDVTPREARRRFARPIPIYTGQLEEHITADVAWAASTYAAWSGDDAFLSGPGRDLVVDTARYWADRIELDAAGAGHIRNVIGPDEYHVGVDDNAFTNVMARWNLQRAAELVGDTTDDGSRTEAERWRLLAGALVDGFDPSTTIYEQFAGYHRLEHIPIHHQAPVAADLLLGAERVAASQVIKQGDVLMLHHLVPEAVAAGSLGPNLDHYLARTAHGSSLSPAIYAALLARAGRPDEALGLMRLALSVDLADLTGSSAGGLHLATMGGAWQAMAMGFAGLVPKGETLALAPQLPADWTSLGLRLRWRGVRVGLVAHHDRVEVECDAPITVAVCGRPDRRVSPPGTVLETEPGPTEEPSFAPARRNTTRSGRHAR
jgi:trehalose/maltose hydrolase-like predicted phosphorylase